MDTCSIYSLTFSLFRTSSSMYSIEEGSGQCECKSSQEVTKLIRMGLRVILNLLMFETEGALNCTM